MSQHFQMLPLLESFISNSPTLSELLNHPLHHLLSIFNLFLPTYAFLSEYSQTFENECSQIFLIPKILPLSQSFTPFPISANLFVHFYMFPSFLTCIIIGLSLDQQLSA